ncbi:MAG: hypothetical protein WC738_02880 [Candidatus Omnitrophota bacterium]|jgi:hypothetical protein
MKTKLLVCLSIALAFCFVLSAVSYSADETTGAKAKNFWQKLFNYPANVANESASVVVDTAKRTTSVVTKEVKTVGQVTSGDIAKTKELVTEPVTGTADTTVKAVEETVNVHAKAVETTNSETPQAAQK